MRLFLSFLALSLSASLASQTVLLQEGFDGDGLPAGWSQQTLASDGGWLVGDNQSLQSQWWSIAPHGSFMATNDDGCDCDKSADYLILPELDLSGLDQALLTMASYYDGGEYEGATEVATVEYSFDAGETWTVLETIQGDDNGEWGFEVISLEALLGETSVWLALRYNDDGGWLYGWAVDDVGVLEPGGLDLALASVNVEPVVFAPTEEDLSGTVVNLGMDTVYSYTIAWSMGDESGTTDVDGVALGTGDSDGFNINNAIAFDGSGSFEIEVSISECERGFGRQQCQRRSSCRGFCGFGGSVSQTGSSFATTCTTIRVTPRTTARWCSFTMDTRVTL